MMFCHITKVAADLELDVFLKKAVNVELWHSAFFLHPVAKMIAGMKKSEEIVLSILNVVR